MRIKVFIVTFVALAVTAGAAVATEGYSWLDHAAPFDYKFGNHIDTHQQSLVEDGMLQGFFYITLGDEIDPGSGLPITTHGNCSVAPDGCSVGWVWHGQPVAATLVAHGHGQHPTWCVDPAAVPRAPGYSHFHWEGAPAHAGDIAIGTTSAGWLLRLIAVDSFFFEHHGGFAITPGIDRNSHANIVTDCES